MAQKRETETPTETPNETPTATAADDRPKTWWSRHGAVVIAAGALLAIVALVVLNMN
ncbi:MAG TPA: hypothetical protein VGQ83_34270 [Polyangia bacterium]